MVVGVVVAVVVGVVVAVAVAAAVALALGAAVTVAAATAVAIIVALLVVTVVGIAAGRRGERGVVVISQLLAIAFKDWYGNHVLISTDQRVGAPCGPTRHTYTEVSRKGQFHLHPKYVPLI